MRNLHIILPPCAPDYSGAGSALYGLGGMLIYHDASGCTGNYIGYDEPRWMKKQDLVYCSGLRHIDAVLGRDDKLVERAAAAAADMKPAFIALIGSPVPMLTGMDYKGVAGEIEKATGVPCFGFDTKGLDFYDTGVRMASLALLGRYAVEPEYPQRGTGEPCINILGMTPIDFGNEAYPASLKKLFENGGIRVNCCIPLASSLDEIKNFRNAALNVAVSTAGVMTAAAVRKRWGIPYITGTPIGDGGLMLERTKRALAELASGKPVSELPHVKKHSDSSVRKVLIIGEQVCSNSIRELLEKEGMECTVAVMFSHIPELLEAGDLPFVQESDLMEIFESGRYSDVVGDPLLAQLDHGGKLRFHNFPHVAVSSKYCWDDIPNLLSPEFTGFLSDL